MINNLTRKVPVWAKYIDFLNVKSDGAHKNHSSIMLECLTIYYESKE
jgi:hypothetical protein